MTEEVKGGAMAEEVNAGPIYRQALRARAKRLRRNAAGILTIILMVLSAGIAVFVGAGALASREATAAAEERRAAEAKTLREQRQLGMRYVDDRTRAVDQLQSKLVAELAGEGLTHKTGDGPIARQLRMQLHAAEAALVSARRDVDAIDARLEQLQKETIITKPTLTVEEQWLSIVSALSTRVGAVVLLLFLVQILVPLYRYYVRLATFFDARADALEMYAIYGGAHQDIEACARILAPDSVEFGSAPATPAKDAVELAKEILALRREARP